MFFVVHLNQQIISMAQVTGIVIQLNFGLWTNRGLNWLTVTPLKP